MTDTQAQPQKPKLAIEVIPVTPFQQNTSLLWSTNTMEGVFIDPGGEVDKLMERASHHGVTIKQVWLTHGHLDHAGGATHVKERTGAPIIGPHEDDQWLLDSIVEQWAKYGVTDTANCQPDQYLKDGDTLELDGEVFDVIHCPGHTPGHVVIHYRQGGFAFVGDVLFKGSIGRTDFPRGNHQQLIDSITQKLWPLGNHVQFIPGHNAPSTFGHERQTNGFVADHVLGLSS